MPVGYEKIKTTPIFAAIAVSFYVLICQISPLKLCSQPLKSQFLRDIV